MFFPFFFLRIFIQVCSSFETFIFVFLHQRKWKPSEKKPDCSKDDSKNYENYKRHKMAGVHNFWYSCYCFFFIFHFSCFVFAKFCQLCGTKHIAQTKPELLKPMSFNSNVTMDAFFLNIKNLLNVKWRQNMKWIRK